MARRLLSILAIFITLAGCQPQETAQEQPEATKPNFLFILVDDLGWKDLGCYGSSFYETPNLDQLASEGMQFMEAYAACPVCSPTRASIMTGKYPARMHTTDWFGAPQPENAHKHHTGKKPLLPAAYNEQMALEEKTLAEALKENGYATFFAGKWHLGDQGFDPEDQGFDVNKGGFKKGSPPSYFSPYKNPKLSDGMDGEHLPDRLAQETVQFIVQHKDQPFLAYLSFYSVHTPLRSREDLTAKYEAKKADWSLSQDSIWGQEGEREVRLIQEHSVYAGMVEAMDLAIGKVLDKLKDLGLDENTVIVFTSDNGGLSTSEGHPTSNLPLRAGKGWLYEGGIREPLIIKWPGVTPPNSKSSVPVTSTDYYPTFLEMGGLDLEPQQHLDGVSLLPLLHGEAQAPRAIFWHYPHYGNQGGSPGSAVRYGDYKLIRFYEDDHQELYNLKEDIGEKNNLTDHEPEKVEELMGMLDKWLREVGARMPTSNSSSLVATKWRSFSLQNSPADSLFFKNHEDVDYFLGELGSTFASKYELVSDTIVIKTTTAALEVEDASGLEPNLIQQYIVEGDSLIPVGTTNPNVFAKFRRIK